MHFAEHFQWVLEVGINQQHGIAASVVYAGRQGGFLAKVA